MFHTLFGHHNETLVVFSDVLILTLQVIITLTIYSLLSPAWKQTLSMPATRRLYIIIINNLIIFLLLSCVLHYQIGDLFVPVPVRVVYMLMMEHVRHVLYLGRLAILSHNYYCHNITYTVFTGTDVPDPPHLLY